MPAHLSDCRLPRSLSSDSDGTVDPSIRTPKKVPAICLNYEEIEDEDDEDEDDEDEDDEDEEEATDHLMSFEKFFKFYFIGFFLLYFFMELLKA